MNWQNILNSLPGILIGLTVHEFSHAWAAYKLGDYTAKDQGRLTFNPLRHIDPIGFLFIIFAGFGWAKPVQFSPDNLSHPRRDKALIAAAGPLSNLLLALIFIFTIKGYRALLEYSYDSMNSDALFVFLQSETFYRVIMIILQAAVINLGLFVFNLLPIPPLDGSHIFFSGLNLRPETERSIMKIGTPLLFIILIIQNYAGITILPIGKLIFAILGFFIPQLRGN
ncbi:site-2 protease family protein [Leadbettera azotonutricia]|uniref:Peptidase M50 n=1 Tax=Leadbettera azotonutricia (strain ATCC BAA-888 / DSM 13862 / ZAS-9) TaxID=545695 RepID=F5YGC1_LEAAZ|nr:site-2 protease family protein [Leadbettera azotonutricia]AEF82888.1 peptidase M50 [Leadbettera azotonutricia ZAS-9]